MLDEDVVLYKKIKSGFPGSYFFLHECNNSGVKKDPKFGEKYFYKWWKPVVSGLKIGWINSHVNDFAPSHRPQRSIGMELAKDLEILWPLSWRRSMIVFCENLQLLLHL